MSRVGKKPIIIPTGVKVVTKDGRVGVEGPLGRLEMTVPPQVTIEVVDGNILVKKNAGVEGSDPIQGLMRALLFNMTIGVTTGYSKSLMINGTGYRAEVQGTKLVIQVGFTLPVVMDISPDIKISIDRQVQINIKGADKQKVGDWAAKIRAVKPPEPYQGKGIRYLDEVIKKKVGKAAVKQGAA